MVDSEQAQNYKKITVSSFKPESSWHGIPVIYELKDNFICTLSPQQHGETLYI